ncbi:hypothetical protein [Photobacterium damselae]|uniref:phage major capsid protein n=1 Tax=Photobacterium damselae TaxID=38293 RepID=UPI001F490A20|nr:hypothetical protein [Photobacterium damselae]UKA12928.1 hypothetical protein IHC91_21320 [Photobacterium damselae subsp. damselae]
MAVFPIKQGGTGADYASNSTPKFIPQIWSSKLVEKFYKATVFGEIANTDYEGEIKNQGDTVIIRTRPTLKVQDYQKGMDLVYEAPTSEAVELQIKYGKYFAFEVKLVDKVQSDLNLMNEFSTDGAEQMKIAIDADVLKGYIDDIEKNAAAKNGINLGAKDVTKADIIDFIVDLGTALDKNNIPAQGRWIVIPPEIAGLIKKSDLKDASLAGDDTSIARNGRLGMIDRFTLYLSNNLPAGAAKGSTKILFGHKAGITFASQITAMEKLPNPKDFGQYVRSLQVFGFMVLNYEAVGTADVTVK